MKKKGFTLIELLAVIIILGILMLIAIPSVTAYINNSRKNTYVSTINEVVKGTIAKVNNGDLDMYDTDTTYYIPASAINLEGDKLQSPYGEIDDAYVVVTYDGESYDYYFVGKDKANMGVGTVTQSDKINKDSIGEVGTIDKTVGIGGRSKIVVFDKDLVAGTAQGAQSQGGSGGTSGTVCKRATTLHTVGGNTYGNLGSGETINTGDAFDCDVNGDGTYDAATERFYYVTSSNDYGVLIYYSNVRHNGTPSLLGYYSYDEGYSNMGPLTAIGQIQTTNAYFDAPLPSTSKWSNVSLSSTSRRIGNVNFSYEGFAARILSKNEINSVCNTNLETNCKFLLERTEYDSGYTTQNELHRHSDCERHEENGNVYYTGEEYCEYISDSSMRSVNDGYILEDFDYNSQYDNYYGLSVSSRSYGTYPNYTIKWEVGREAYGDLGVRPVIEVPVSKIQK